MRTDGGPQHVVTGVEDKRPGPDMIGGEIDPEGIGPDPAPINLKGHGDDGAAERGIELEVDDGIGLRGARVTAGQREGEPPQRTSAASTSDAIITRR